MLTVATLSSKGQVTIPKAIRNRHHLKPGDKIEFLEDESGSVTMLPLSHDIIRLKGMVAKPEKPVSIEEMNQAISIEGSRR